MRNTRLVMLLLLFCCFIIMTMIILVNLPRRTTSSPTIPVLYPTSVPQAQHSFPSNPPSPLFHSDTTKYQYVGDVLYNLPPTFRLPDKMAGYAVDSYSIAPEQASALASSLGLSSSPEQSSTQAEQFLTWNNTDGKHLQIALQSGTIDYSNSYIPGKNAVVTKLTSKDDVLQAATTFLKSHGLFFSDLSADASDIGYYISNGGEPQVVNTFDTATLFSVTFIRKLNGVTVYTNYGNPSQIVVWLDPFGIVKKASIQYAAVHREAAHTLLGLETAEKAVPYSGVIVHLGNNDRSLSGVAIKTTTFTSISLGYFDDREHMLFYPIYVFSGTALLADNSTADITVYLPALSQ